MNSKNILEMVQEYLNANERYVLVAYRFLNREIIDNNYEISDSTLEVFLEYFKKKKEEKLEKFWKEGVLQRDIFVFSNLSYDYFQQQRDEDIGKYLERKNFHSILKKVLLSYFDEIKELFFKNLDFKVNCIYKDNNFEIFYEKHISEFEYKNYYDAQYLTFYILLDGTLFFQNQILGIKDCFFTYQKLFSKPVKLISSYGTFLIIKIKNKFLRNMNLNPLLERNNFHIYSLENLKFMMTEKRLENIEKILIFRGVIYLIEYLKRINFEILDGTIIEYKQKILKFLDNIEILNEEEIVEKLLIELDVGLSKLYRIFEEIFSITPNKYIQDLKLKRTFKLLTDTDMKIEMIAERFGYSEKVFPQKFIEKTGYLPSTFRKMTKDGE